MSTLPALNANPRDVAAIDLGRVLDRLEKKILSSEVDARLLHSSYERTKTAADENTLLRKTEQNLEYARTLLLRLEHSSSNIKLPSRKQAAQSDLFAQRALIKRLTDRLHDLDSQGDDDDLLYGPEDEEDILGEDPPLEPSSPSDSKILQSTVDEPAATLRNRQNPRQSPSTVPADSQSIGNPDLLAANDTESANLTSSLFTLAQALKASSTQFSESLTTDTETLNRATEGLDKNAAGMEAAGKRMGLLKRMSEGKGWWGRMMLYAWIAGLWVLAILLVFVGPKLRF